MQSIAKEYVVLFNTLTDAENVLVDLRRRMMDAQRLAEELFIGSNETDGEPGEETLMGA